MASRPSPRRGDMIEIHRIGYSHWAIYVGDGYVVHLNCLGGCAGANKHGTFGLIGTAVVKKELLSTVAERCYYQVNNKYDDRYPPLPITEIVTQALELVGKTIGYSLICRNCEPFVTGLRYRVPCCDQLAEVTNIAVGAGVFAVVAGVMVGALGLIGILLCRMS